MLAVLLYLRHCGYRGLCAPFAVSAEEARFKTKKEKEGKRRIGPEKIFSRRQLRTESRLRGQLIAEGCRRRDQSYNKHLLCSSILVYCANERHWPTFPKVLLDCCTVVGPLMYKDKGPSWPQHERHRLWSSGGILVPSPDFIGAWT